MDESRTRSNATGGIGFLGALAIVFIALKLTGYIAWSWLWVLSPVWIPWTLLGGVLVVACVVFFASYLQDKLRRRIRRRMRKPNA